MTKLQAKTLKTNEKRVTKLLDLFGLRGRERKAIKYVIQGSKPLYSKTTSTRIVSITRKFKSGKLQLARHIARNPNYKENKEFLSEQPTISELAATLTRTTFYYENKNTVIKYNEIKANGDFRTKEGRQVKKELSTKFDAWRSKIKADRADFAKGALIIDNE